MARGVMFTYPLDEPAMQKPGVLYREADYHGSAARLALPPEHPLRADKGDLGMVVWKDFEPRALSHVGLPFGGLTDGKRR